MDIEMLLNTCIKLDSLQFKPIAAADYKSTLRMRGHTINVWKYQAEKPSTNNHPSSPFQAAGKWHERESIHRKCH